MFKWDKDHAIDTQGNFDPDAPIFFAKQVISNACATMAILSILMNHAEIDIGPHLSELKEFTGDFSPEMRGLAIGGSEVIRTAHNSFGRVDPFVFAESASSSSGAAYHFVSYVPINGTVYELDGLQPAPKIVGTYPVETSWLQVACPAIIQRMTASASADIHFNLMAVTQSEEVALAAAQESAAAMDDVQARNALLHSIAERRAKWEEKKARWHRDSVWRSHNYIPFLSTFMRLAAEGNILKPHVEASKEACTSPVKYPAP